MESRERDRLINLHQENVRLYRRLFLSLGLAALLFICLLLIWILGIPVSDFETAMVVFGAVLSFLNGAKVLPQITPGSLENEIAKRLSGGR